MRKWWFIAGLTLGATSVNAIEVTPEAQLRAQVSLAQFDEEKYEWALQMPETYVVFGLNEAVGSARFLGHFQVGVDPLVPNGEEAFSLIQSYLGGDLGYVSVRAGTLETLEYSYIVRDASYLYSLPLGGLQFFADYDLYQSHALRFTSKVGDYLQFDNQIVLDPQQSALPYAFSGSINTYEGAFSITYHKDPEEAPRWSNQLSYFLDGSEIRYVWLYQEGFIGYALDFRVEVRPYQIYFGYSRNIDVQRWHAGASQQISEAVLGYSEFMWDAQQSTFQWSSGVSINL